MKQAKQYLLDNYPLLYMAIVWVVMVAAAWVLMRLWSFIVGPEEDKPSTK